MKNRLSRKSPEQLANLTLEQAYRIGYADGSATSSSVVEGESIMHEGLFLRKVNREAREGDYIRPNKTVESMLIDGKIYGPVDEWLRIICLPVYSNPHNRTSETVEVFEVVSDSPPQIIKSANQQRAELIKKAKKFVKSSIRSYPSFGATKFEFVVNAEKRTVVALERGNRTRKVYKKGIAKCHPNEVFNAEIGKAIALGRALEISIPGEFLQAVQPNGVVAGHIISWHDKPNEPYKVNRRVVDEFDFTDISENKDYKDCEYCEIEGYASIIDDTNAQYQVHQ